jgi:diaminopimelate epimerase
VRVVPIRSIRLLPSSQATDHGTRRTLWGMDFTLAHGTENDFVVLGDLDGRHELSADLARALCHRRRGLGADGVLRIAPGEGDAQVFMDHRNADGSTAEMCGNGVRVVAKYVVDRDLAALDADGVLRVGTRGGTKPVTVHRGDDGLVAAVTVDMGAPILDPAEVPFEADDPDALVHEVVIDDMAGLVPKRSSDNGSPVRLSVVSMGNPHGVVQVDDVATAPVTELGPRLETHRRFPAKANIGFVEVVDRGQVRLRVWERGVGETAACGTGACAAVVALQRLGLVDDEVAVHLPGGTLQIDHVAGGTVMMTGPAVEIASGRLDAHWPTSTDPTATADHAAPSD